MTKADAREEQGAKGQGSERWVTLAVGLLFCLPLAAATYPPMLDYPQHLALATIVAQFQDSVFGFAENYSLHLTKPNALFELVVAALMAVMSANMAGKLILALAVVATGFSGVALARRAGGSWWMGLVALPIFYSHIFYWGFVGNLLAVPMLFYALIYADRVIDEGGTAIHSLGIFLWAVAFYLVHAQFAFLFAGGALWLVICNWRSEAILRVVTPAAVGAVLCGIFSFLSLENPGAFEQGKIAAPLFTTLGARLAVISELVFGAQAQAAHALPTALVLLILGAAMAARQTGMASDGLLHRRRFLLLGLTVWGLYFIMPLNIGQYLVQERLAPLATMMVLVSLPAFSGTLERVAKVLVLALLVVQFSVVGTGALIFDEEAAGLTEVLDGTEPGKKLMGLVASRDSVTLQHPDVFVHFPALYQVHKGGQVNFSFAELVQSVARPLPGKSFDPVLAEVEPRNLARFDADRHGAGFDYFLVRGTPKDVAALFGGAKRKLQIRTKGRWHLLW